MTLLQEPINKYTTKKFPDFVVQKKAMQLVQQSALQPKKSEPRSLKEIMEKMGLIQETNL